MSYNHKMKRAERERLNDISYFVNNVSVVENRLEKFSFRILNGKEPRNGKELKYVQVFLNNRLLFTISDQYNSVNRSVCIMMNDANKSERTENYVRMVVEEMIRFTTKADKMDRAMEEEDVNVKDTKVDVTLDISLQEFAAMQVTNDVTFSPDENATSGVYFIEATHPDLEEDRLRLRIRKQYGTIHCVVPEEKAETIKDWAREKAALAMKNFRERYDVAEMFSSFPTREKVSFCETGIFRIIDENRKKPLNKNLTNDVLITGTIQSGEVKWRGLPFFRYSMKHDYQTVTFHDWINAITNEERSLYAESRNEIEYTIFEAVVEAAGFEMKDFTILDTDAIHKEMEAIDFGYF